MAVPTRTVSAEEVDIKEIVSADFEQAISDINYNFQQLVLSPTIRGIAGNDGVDGQRGETGTRGSQIYTTSTLPSNPVDILEGDVYIKDNGVISQYIIDEFVDSSLQLLTTENTYTKNEVNALISGSIASINTDSLFNLKLGQKDPSNDELAIPDGTGDSAHEFIFLDSQNQYSFLLGNKSTYNTSASVGASNFSPLEGQMPKLIIQQDNAEEGILLGIANTSFDDYASIRVREITPSQRYLGISHDEIKIASARENEISSGLLNTIKTQDKYVDLDSKIFEVGETGVEFRVDSDLGLISNYMDTDLNLMVLSFNLVDLSNNSHIWYDEVAKEFHFVTESTRKSQGNARIVGGEVKLIDETTSESSIFTYADKLPKGVIFEWSPVGGESVTDYFETNPLSPNYGLGKGKWSFLALCNGLNGTVDKRGKMSYGYNPEVLDYAVIGGSVGNNTITLQETNLPSHTHGVNETPHAHGVNETPHRHERFELSGGLDLHPVEVGSGSPFIDQNTDDFRYNINNIIDAGISLVTGGVIRTSESTVGMTVNTSTTGISIQSTGSGTPIDIRQSGVVTVFFQRIV